MLNGTTICLTRTPEQSAPMKRELEALGARVLLFPTIELTPPPDDSIIAQAVGELDTYDWLIFTSANAVHAFFKYLNADSDTAPALSRRTFGCGYAARGRSESVPTGFCSLTPFANVCEDGSHRRELVGTLSERPPTARDIPSIAAVGPSTAVGAHSHAPAVTGDLNKRAMRTSPLHPTRDIPSIAAVGPSTAEALHDYGVACDLMPKSDFQAEGLIGVFETLPHAKGERVLIPRALRAREILPEALTQMGYEVTVAPVYETKRATPDSQALAVLPTVDAFVFTSPSTARNFTEIVNGAGLDALTLLNNSTVFSIGPVTTDELQRLGLPRQTICQPPHATTASLTKTICQKLA